jgi:hypothetical protein
MKERVTQALLAAIVVLLVVHLIRATPRSQAQTGVGEGAQDVLRCRALQIVDDLGRVRASIKLHPANPKVTMPNGKTQPEMVLLRLIDENGRPSVKLWSSDQGAGLMVGGAKDPTYARIMSDLGSSTVLLKDKEGREKLITP